MYPLLFIKARITRINDETLLKIKDVIDLELERRKDSDESLKK
jgi:hypothetical protein